MTGLLARLKLRASRVLYRPRIKVSSPIDTIRLGSEYGGWTFIDHPDLRGSTILSFGLGEDASFDVEFAVRYNSKVIILDPTPRAVTHFQQPSQRSGLGASESYRPGGRQPIQAYDLRHVAPHQLELGKQAVSNQSGTAKFYAPPDDRNISHSLVALQNAHYESAPYITVSVISISDIKNRIPLENISLVKMDIEGAETYVLEEMLAMGFFPGRLLVEFDEINFPLARPAPDLTTSMNASDSTAKVLFTGTSGRVFHT